MKLTKAEEMQILKQREEQRKIEESRRTSHLWRSCSSCSGRGSTGYFGPYMDKDDYRECYSCGGKGRWQITQEQHDAEQKAKLADAEQKLQEAQERVRQLKEKVR